ncbi:hypothetical protein [Streptomyces sp. ISL-100]|uniref:hypothetical protein n=1 Tax=Streptomyces sp. ISL-100 TaxID=2819173 RepID=UPI001BEC3DBC|nr:hypothetical protein [Streptomyces sp. ISL-100]MBT2396543.1 hypothetical protein [Streptomyces sp. ISL-100]
MANADWSVNMPHCIAHIFEPLWRLAWPAEGRHRRADRRSSAASTGTPTARLPHVPMPPLRGEGIGIVRPHLVAHERQEARRQRIRRRALWLAVHGIDVGSRLIHGVEVTA